MCDEELVDCVKCVCVCLGAVWKVSELEHWDWALPILGKQGECYRHVSVLR